MYIDSQNIIKTDDISFYDEKECSYFPSLDDFEYKENVVGFYTYDSSYSVAGSGAISYVSELQFATKETYDGFLEYERKRYEYDVNPTVLKNDYECYLCLDEETTRYYYGKDMPYALAMLCLNEKDLKVRCLYYVNIQYSIDKHYNDVFRNTNCDW